MKNIILTRIVMLTLIASVLASDTSEADKVKKVIESAYVQGIHIESDVKKIRSGFHPDFSMLILKDNEIVKVTIEDWISRIEESKKKKNPSTKVITHKFETVDVTGNAAVARIEDTIKRYAP